MTSYEESCLARTYHIDVCDDFICVACEVSSTRRSSHSSEHKLFCKSKRLAKDASECVETQRHWNSFAKFNLTVCCAPVKCISLRLSSFLESEAPQGLKEVQGGGENGAQQEISKGDKEVDSAEERSRSNWERRRLSSRLEVNDAESILFE